MTGIDDYTELKYVATAEQEGCRVDKFLALMLKDHSRSYIQRLIKDGRVTVEGKIAKSSTIIKEDEQIIMTVPALCELDLQAQDMHLDILYEDEDVILVNKPKGMVVHPAPGRYTDTLVNGLLYHCKNELSGINGIMRPGIVHRIDKDTTGVLIVCKNDFSHNSIAAQLKDHSIKRRYEAIVYNNINEEEGRIEADIGRSTIDRKKMAIVSKNGKHAVTHYRVIDHLNRRFNHIECRLETGRTHQIRVHMASINHPLLGDQIYGPSNNPKGQIYKDIVGQCLHAGVLGFVHPRTGEYMEFSAPLPEYFKALLDKLGNEKY